jgi:hypothetical protein
MFRKSKNILTWKIPPRIKVHSSKRKCVSNAFSACILCLYCFFCRLVFLCHIWWKWFNSTTIRHDTRLQQQTTTNYSSRVRIFDRLRAFSLQDLFRRYGERKKTIGQQSELLLEAGKQLQDDLKLAARNGNLLNRRYRNLKLRESEFRKVPHTHFFFKYSIKTFVYRMF